MPARLLRVTCSSLLGAVLSTVLLLAPCAARAAPGDVLVFAAASTRDALAAAIAAFDRGGEGRVVASYGGSSTLARQIIAGAPAHLFLSANTEWMDGVVAAGLVEAASVVPSFGNALVVIAPTASAQGPLPGADAISGALGDGRLALAEPSAVPAGIYARQALERLGVWAALLPKLVPAKDVRSALVFVERGEAPLGIVYGTDAAASSLVRVVWQVPDGLHDPVIYPLALTRLGAAQPAAGAFFAYLKSDAGRRHFADRGFALR